MPPEQPNLVSDLLNSELSSEPATTTISYNAVDQNKKKRIWVWISLAIALFIVLLLSAGIFYQKYRRSPEVIEQKSHDVKSQDINLSDLSIYPTGDPSEVNRVIINGQLQTNNSIVLKPTQQPVAAVVGQIYYDSAASSLRFFNGRNFQTLVSGDASLLNGGQFALPQDLRTVASPQFAGMTVGGKTVCVAGKSCDGYQEFGDYLTAADIASLKPLPQNLEVTASPQFAGLRLKNGTGGVVSLQSSATSNTLSFTLPSNNGLANECLLTDGNGTLYFGSCSSGAGNAFVQGGNSFGAMGVLGTTDNNDMRLITNNNTVATFAANGQILMQAAPSMNGAWQVIGNSNIPVLTVGTFYGSFGGVGIGTIGPGAKLHVVQQGIGDVNSDTLLVNNSSSLGRIARFQDGGIPVMSIYDGGSIMLQNSVDSTSALQVLNSSGSNILTLDSTNRRAGFGAINSPAATLDVRGTDNTSVTAQFRGATGQSQDIFRLLHGDNGTSLLSVSSEGSTTVKTNTNSSSAFDVRNSLDSKVINISTTPTFTQIVPNPDFENSDISPWSSTNGASFIRTNSNKYMGNYSMSATTSASANSGLRVSVPFSANTQYTLTFYARTTSGNFDKFRFGRQANPSDGEKLCYGYLSADWTVTNNGWKRFTCTFTTAASVSGPFLFFKQDDAISRTFYIDNLTLAPGSASKYYMPGTVNTSALFQSPMLLQASENSADTLLVKTAQDSDLLRVDTLTEQIRISSQSNIALTVSSTQNSALTAVTSANSYYAINTLALGGGGGVSSIGWNLPGVYGSSLSNISGLFQTYVQDGSNTNPTLVARANTLQTADLVQLQDSNSAILSGFDYQGQLYLISGGFRGTVRLASLSQNTDFTLPASSSNSDTICLQNLANCTSGGIAFIQGGNSFGATATLGTKDNHDMRIIANNQISATYAANGQITLQAGASMNGAFQVLGNSATPVLTVGTLLGSYGAVGIGTTGPAAKLHVVQQGSNSPALWVSNSASIGPIAVFSDDLTDVMSIEDGGAIILQNSINSNSALSVKNTSGNTLLQVDTINSRVGINIPFSNPAAALEVGGAIRLSSNNMDQFLTPAGTLVDTKVNVPLINVGSYGQIMALGIDDTSSSSTRVISVFDGRTSTNNQPPLAVFNVSENDVLGLGWDGGNSTAYLKTMNSNIGIRSGTTDIATFLGSGNVGINNTNPANRLNLNTLTTADNNAQLAVSTGGVNNKAIVIQGVNGQVADLFQAQSNTGAVLASISASGALTVASATINGTIAINGHMKTGNTSGNTTISAGAASCSSPTVSIAGNDTAGTVSITAGSSCPMGGELASVNFANSFAAAPIVILTPAGANAASIQYFSGSSTTTGFTIDTSSQLITSQLYKYNYFVIE